MTLDPAWVASPYWNPHGGRVRQMPGGRLAQFCKVKSPPRAYAGWGHPNRYALRYLDTGELEFTTPAKVNRETGG